MNIIDRRLNPQGKSLANRQRFIKRAKEQIQRAVREASSSHGITDLDKSEKVGIPIDSVSEPVFQRSRRGGTRHYVVPGNKKFSENDEIQRPRDGGGGQGSQAGDDGGGEDEFQFILTKEEFLNIFLDDLELPDLVKANQKQTASVSLSRAGHSSTGNPSNLNLVRTMRNSLSRRIALKRPSAHDLAEIRTEIADAEEAGHSDDAEALQAELERQLRRTKLIPYLDPVDVRYNRFQPVPKPVTQAVMYCLMDVSGSMTEHMKDLAKRFFKLLYFFLKRRYSHVEVVFIRHTHEAKVVDEETFFYSRETGGTIVSTALEEMQKSISQSYPPADWNIYAAQASDGDNLASDAETVSNLMEKFILPACQYYAYLEVDRAEPLNLTPDHRTDLWRTYEAVAKGSGGKLAMKQANHRKQIFPVFRELFTPRQGS